MAYYLKTNEITVIWKELQNGKILRIGQSEDQTLDDWTMWERP